MTLRKPMQAARLDPTVKHDWTYDTEREIVASVRLVNNETLPSIKSEPDSSDKETLRLVPVAPKSEAEVDEALSICLDPERRSENPLPFSGDELSKWERFKSSIKTDYFEFLNYLKVKGIDDIAIGALLLCVFAIFFIAYSIGIIIMLVKIFP